MNARTASSVNRTGNAAVTIDAGARLKNIRKNIQKTDSIMKIPKVSIAVAAAAVLTALCVSAQTQTVTNNEASSTNRAAPPMRVNGAEARLDQLSKALDLTDEQKPQVKAVLEEETKAIREARSTVGDGTPEERRAKYQSIREATSAKLKNILTTEQYTKYESLPQVRGGARRPLAPGNPPANPPAGPKDKKE